MMGEDVKIEMVYGVIVCDVDVEVMLFEGEWV